MHERPDAFVNKLDLSGLGFDGVAPEAMRLLIQGCVNSFVKAEHVLDGIHDGRFAVLEAI